MLILKRQTNKQTNTYTQTNKKTLRVPLFPEYRAVEIPREWGQFHLGNIWKLFIIIVFKLTSTHTPISKSLFV